MYIYSILVIELEPGTNMYIYSILGIELEPGTNMYIYSILERTRDKVSH